MKEIIQQSEVILLDDENAKLIVTNPQSGYYASGDVDTNCYLDQGDIVTSESSELTLLGINSPTCQNCLFKKKCISYNPDLNILPVAEKF